MSSVDKVARGYQEVFKEVEHDDDASASKLAKDAQGLVLQSLLSKLKPLEDHATAQAQAPAQFQVDAQPEPPAQSSPQSQLPPELQAQRQPQAQAQPPSQPEPQPQPEPQAQPREPRQQPPVASQQGAAQAQRPLPQAVQPQAMASSRAAAGPQAFAPSAKGGGASSSSSAVFKGSSVASTLESIFGDIPVMYTIQFRSLMGGEGGVTEHQLIERILKAQEKGDQFGKWLSGYLNPWRSAAATNAVRSALPMLMQGPRAQLDPKKLTQELAKDLSTALALAAGAIAKDWQRSPLTASQRKRLKQFYDVLMDVMPNWPPRADMSFQELAQMWLDAIRSEQDEPGEDEEELRVDEDGGHGQGRDQDSDHDEEDEPQDGIAVQSRKRKDRR